MRTLRGAGIGLIIMIAVALAGCSAPAVESRLDEYRDRAEQIHADMLDHVPGNSAFEDHVTSQPQFGEPHLLGGGQRDTAFWTTWSTVEVTADTMPADAAGAVGASLLDRQWTAEPTVDQGGTMSFITVYRLGEPDGEWIVQISWPADAADRRISLSVQSPLTVRGDTSRTDLAGQQGPYLR
ncbi:hypothetical protein [Paeniglutamicibacter sp. Y32M11]|uniref:hypothetical protein n=1 Tax=Paeniglutamicibacter sp. Y32M11 TaxID=2853258 RepID=UPI0010E5255F|nr:hypothetical protein [Paeniglutamicibacter sp. Y32M11]QXQ09683.1 hypothetical protein KUF55_14655 [Paeniglutamicibacter sp. Y32M11]